MNHVGGANGGSPGAPRPRVLLAHAGMVIANAAQRILDAHGFDARITPDSEGVERALAEGGWDALVVDVALPGAAGFELAQPAREAGVKVVILVASVFRRTSYKRRPSRLYGADDYVEIHHLGDHLPNRLRAHLGHGSVEDLDELPTLRDTIAALYERGDERLGQQTPEGLAQLIVADVLLYNGDRITEAATVEDALAAIAADLDGARELFEQVRPRGGELERSGRDLIAEAVHKLVVGLDVHKPSPTSSPEEP